VGELLILVVLLVSIPRWAETLAQVDAMTVFGIPVTALGQGIVIELGSYYILRVFNATRQAAAEYRAWWGAHDARMREQDKVNRKPENDPRLRGYQALMAAFLLLLALAFIAQTPFVMHMFTGRAVFDLLPYGLLWGYSAVLVVSPGVVIAALALGTHYHGIVRKDAGESDGMLASLRTYAAQMLAGLRREQRTKPQPVAESEEAASTSGRGISTSACICEHCGAQFATVQARSAHLRFCELYLAHKANGGDLEIQKKGEYND